MSGERRRHGLGAASDGAARSCLPSHMPCITPICGTSPFRPAFLRTIVIGLMAFLTVVDLFATQAILPSLARAYSVSPAAMGFAVNACTIGMAVAGLAVALFSQRIDRRSASSSASRCWRYRRRCSPSRRT